MGNVGFRTLLTRSLSLAAAEAIWLRAVRVSADGTFEGLDPPEGQLDQKMIAVGKVVLLAELFGLLVAFIGESLTLRLLGDIWPELSFNDLDFGAGVTNEKTK